jgi:hypothetical protein
MVPEYSETTRPRLILQLRTWATLRFLDCVMREFRSLVDSKPCIILGLNLIFGGQGRIQDAVGDAGDTYHLGDVVDADDVRAV